MRPRYQAKIDAETSRSDRGLNLAFRIALMALVPFFGFLPGIVAAVYAACMLTQPGYSAWQRRSMAYILLFASALAALWIWLITH
jgi:hypothetical protein